MTTTWPSLKEVRSLLRLQPDPTEDAVIQTALSAAVDFGMRRFGYVWVYDQDTGLCTRVYRYPPDSDQVPDSGHEACLLHAARL